MFDAQDFDPIGVIEEADAPVADTEAELRGMSAVECFHIAGSCLSEAVNRAGDANGDSAIENGQVGLRLAGNHDAFNQAGSW